MSVRLNYLAGASVLVFALLSSGCGQSAPVGPARAVSFTQARETPPPPASPEVTSKSLRTVDLQDVTSVTVADGVSLRKGKFTTDAAVIRSVKDHLGAATFFGDNRANVSRGPEGSYLLFLGLRNGSEVRLCWWNDGRAPNLRDMGQQDWWVISGLDEVIKPILP